LNIQVSDILDHLVTRYASAPSTMGAQLERMRFGVHSTPDPHRARAEAEDHMLQQAVLLRCIDEFIARYEFSVPARGPGSSAVGYKIIEKIQKATKLGQGVIAISVLRAYQERCTQSPERGLVEVYNYLASVAPECVPKPPKGDMDLLQAFRSESAKRARAMAAEAYADALLALQNHVRIFNKKGRR
jgi:hypothetical protein